MLRILILALCLLAVLVPVAFIAIAFATAGVTVATARHIEKPRRDLQRLALLSLTPFRAPPAAALR